MRCVYINLDSQTERRETIERNFAEVRAEGWSLTRYPAIDTRYVAERGVPGSLRPAEKACYLSHMSVIAADLDRGDRLMVLEDDAMFGASTHRLVDEGLERSRDLDWDIIFTDLCIPMITTMYDLLKLRAEYRKTRQGVLLSVAQFPFGGATAYIVSVNAASPGSIGAR